MAKKTAPTVIPSGKCAEFRGIPIAGKIRTFLNKIEKQFGYTEFDMGESQITVDGTFVGVHAQPVIRFSIISKTVYEVDVYTYIDYEKEYLHYKQLYTTKYGEPFVSYDSTHDEEESVWELENTRIRLYPMLNSLHICYTNTINEALAKKEHDIALLAEI